MFVAATTSPSAPDSLTTSLPAPVPTFKFADDVFAAVAKATSTVLAVTNTPVLFDVIPIPLAPTRFTCELAAFPEPSNKIVPDVVLASGPTVYASPDICIVCPDALAENSFLSVKLIANSPACNVLFAGTAEPVDDLFNLIIEAICLSPNL